MPKKLLIYNPNFLTEFNYLLHQPLNYFNLQKGVKSNFSGFLISKLFYYKPVGIFNLGTILIL